MRGLRGAAVCLALSLSGSAQARQVSSNPCALSLRHVVAPALRFDTLLGTSWGLVTLAGPGRIPFLPHDDLWLLGRPARRIALPSYSTPPGIAILPTLHAAAIAINGSLWVVDLRTGRVMARRPLDMQAVGWPAAITAGPGNTVYLIGQPGPESPAARAEALQLGTGRPRVLWRQPLGLTHAGIWLAWAGAGRLAVYIPDPSDTAGAIAILNAGDGTMLHSYAVPAPPVGADTTAQRLYVDDAGSIHAYSLYQGNPVASAAGDVPAVSVPHSGLVAYTRGARVVLARATALRPLASLSLPGVTALGVWSGNLIAASPDGVVTISLGGCRG